MSDVSEYLYFGYVQPRWNFDFSYPNDVNLHSYYVYEPQSVGYLLDEILEDLLPPRVDSIIVPISGGWDSRVLLSWAVERFGRSRVIGVSFGSRGLLDFDLGAGIANLLGVEHVGFDLSAHQVSWPGLLSSVVDAPWTYVPDAYYNRVALARFLDWENSVVFSGFMGDPLTGGHFSSPETLDKARRNFITSERREKRLNLSAPGFDPMDSLPLIAAPPTMKHGEALDIGLRQSSCIAPIVTPACGWRRWGGQMGELSVGGPIVLAPFADARWAHYWVNAPDSAKRNQSLYRAMIVERFKSTAEFPSKWSHGSRSALGRASRKGFSKLRRLAHQWAPLRFNRPVETLNYMDFAAAFRHREDYREILETAFFFLADRNVVPWLDLEKIKGEHLSFRTNREDALLVLVGLAANLRVLESK